MNEKMATEEIRIIKEAFDEKRNIIGYAPEEMISVSEGCRKGGDIFITEEGELIDLEYQMNDFDEVELAEYTELAEELYKINNVRISIYILCPKTIRITAPECTIKSEANFTIRLACFDRNPTQDVFHHLKEKVDKHIKLNDEDLETLSKIPLMKPAGERKRLRIECFRLMIKDKENSDFPF